MKRKEIKDVIKKFTYKNKKSLCIFMVLAVLAGGIVIVKINSYKSQQTIDSENYARTVFVEKGEINRSINVNGKIESAEVSMVSTSLTEKVKSVNVKVGDYVKAGDVICTLDDGDITKEIEKKKSEIAENKKDNTIDKVLKLPEKYRVVIHLFYYQEMSIEEISDTLQIGKSAVKTRLSRGRKLLEKIIREEEALGG